ncbi:MAG: hypothetical protein NTX49_07020 [Chlamydiae bacterium]|nr:hypothetical protein [Chlamydiota bacterium]
MAAISTNFQKLEFASNSVENPRCSNCWEQGSIKEPLFDLHPSSTEHHLICRDCTTSWLTNEDLSIKKIFQCYICEQQVNVDQTVTTALGITLTILPPQEIDRHTSLPAEPDLYEPLDAGDDEEISDGYVIVGSNRSPPAPAEGLTSSTFPVDNLSVKATAPSRSGWSYMPAPRVQSLLAKIGLISDPCIEGEVAAQWHSSERAAGGAASAAFDTQMPARVSFPPDCKDVRSGRRWRALTEETLDAQVKKTFDTLSNPYPTQGEIAKLLQVQLTVDLFVKYSETRYHNARHRYVTDIGSLAHVEGAFYDALNETAEEVVRSQRIEAGIAFMNQLLFAILDKCFTHDEESTATFNSRYNGEVLAMCKPIISDMLQKPSVSRVLEAFFLDNLEGDLSQRR